jgi:acetoin utilization deacetylase AcuC-like enzyme
MPTDRASLIRKAIEEAQPAEDFIAEQTREIDDKDIYQAHLDALTKEYNALQTEEYLNEIEALSVRALAAYSAHNHKMKEQTVCAIVAAYFHVDDLRKLHKHDYDAVIEYLVDFNPVKLIN